MKIFYTFDEIRTAIGFANINNELSTLEPYITAAVEDILLTIVGEELMQELVAKAEDDSFEPGFETLLWEKIKVFAAHYGYYLYANDGTVSISDTGITRIEDGINKSAYQWQVREFKAARFEAAYAALYNIAVKLWKQQNATWLADTERLQIEKMLLWKMSDWKQARSLFSWYSFLAIVGHVSYVLDKKIIPLIGDEVYEELLAEVAEAGEETPENAKLLKCIRQALAHFSIIEAAKEINFKLTSNGLQVVEIDAISSNDTVIRSLNAQEKEDIIAHATRRGNEAMCCIENIINPPAEVSTEEEATEPQTKVVFLG